MMVFSSYRPHESCRCLSSVSTSVRWIAEKRLAAQSAQHYPNSISLAWSWKFQSGVNLESVPASRRPTPRRLHPVRALNEQRFYLGPLPEFRTDPFPVRYPSANTSVSCTLDSSTALRLRCCAEFNHDETPESSIGTHWVVQ
jgi:hypothetical protein